MGRGLGGVPDDDGSFGATFADEFGGVHRYLRRRVGAKAADDIAAETFATAFRNWDRLDAASCLADLSDREIAEALSLPLGTVKSRLHRARQHVRNSIARNGKEEAMRMLTASNGV